MSSGDSTITPWYKEPDTYNRGYNVGVATLVTVDMLMGAWEIYTGANPVGFIAWQIAKICADKFADHCEDILVHSARAKISKDSGRVAKLFGVGLDILRIGKIVRDIRKNPYRSDIGMTINKVDILNHGYNLANSAYYALKGKAAPKPAPKTD